MQALANTNLVSYVAPVFAAVVGWLVLAEPVDAPMVAGFALVVVGLGLIKRRELAEKRRQLRRAVGR